MVVDALKSGALKENMEIIEPTSGNTRYCFINGGGMSKY